MKLAFLGDYFVAAPRQCPQMGAALTALLSQCDAAIVNFEGPIKVQGAHAAFKTGPALCQQPAALQHLRDHGVTAISVANNHAHDFGHAGLTATADAATAAGLGVAGLERNGMPAPLIIEAGGMTAAVLGFTEQEWCGTAQDGIGIAILDVIPASRAIRRVRPEADAVIAILHANNEYNALPSPALRETARYLIECGADAVLIHHAHVISGMERHLDRPIYYGLGNFQFTMGSTNLAWFEGLCAVIDIDRGGDGQLAIISRAEPVTFDRDSYAADLATGEQRDQILREHAALSLNLASTDAVAANYAEFVAAHDAMYSEMLNPFASSNRLLRLIGRIWVKRVLLRKRRFSILLNSYRCQSHREAMIRHLARRL